MDIKLNFLRKVSIKEKSLFTRALATMISSGLPITRSFEILSRQTENDHFRSVINNIIKRLEEGEALSVALMRHRDVFDDVYISTIKAGESTGKFEQILKQLADQQEKEYKLASSVKAAVAYPVFITFAMIVAGFLLLTLVIPKMTEVFKETNVELPMATKALIYIGNFMASYWYLIILGFVGLVIWVRYYLKTPAGKASWGRLILSVPVIKEFYTDVYMTRFTRTLSMLIDSGVPIMTAVTLVSDVIDNSVYEKVLKKVVTQLERGVPMSTPLSESDAFPPIVSQMVAVGEQTGKLDEILMVLSNFYEQETDQKVKTLSSLLEPVLLIIIGLGVGTIVFSIIVPLYQSTSNLSG